MSGVTSGIGSGLNSMIADWSNVQSMINQLASQYRSILQQLKGMDPGTRLWLFQLECMPLVIDSGELNMKLESDALNISTAIRTEISNVQADYNNIINNLGPGKSGAMGSGAMNAARAFISDIHVLSATLNMPGLTKIFGASQLGNLNNWRNTLEQTIGSGNMVTTTHAYMVTAEFSTWYNQAGIAGGGQNAPQFQSMNSSFQNLNEVVSGVSAQTQAVLQMYNQNLQQYLAVYNNLFTDYNQWSGTIVANFKST